MEITPNPHDDLLELVIAGRLDNESDEHLRKAVDDYIRQGQHRIVVDLGAVSFVSSAGIAELLHCQQKLSAIQGFFAVCNPSQAAANVLRQTKLFELLVHDRDSISSSSMEGTVTRETRTLVESRGGIDLEVFEIEKGAVLSCNVVGRSEPLFESTYGAQDCQSESFPVGTFGLGLGAFGSSFEDCRTRFGDFLAAAGAVAHSSCHDFGVPDYLMATEEFVPKVHVLYGLKCEGSFGRLLRFNRSEGGGSIELANLIGTSLECTSCETAGFVILAECDGLVGASLKKSPVHNGNSAATRFEFPQVREWISFGGERTHRRSLAVVVGVATSRQPGSPLDPMLRPLGAHSGLQGHFHAAAFPFQPLKKRSLDLVSTVTSMFGAGTIQSVLHLLDDDRPILGAGQSEFLSGAVWISPINKITSQG